MSIKIVVNRTDLPVQICVTNFSKSTTSRRNIAAHAHRFAPKYGQKSSTSAAKSRLAPFLPFLYLTPPDVRTLEVRVKEQVEVEGDVLARVVDADVHVELLLAQDEAVGDAERAVPQRARVLVVRQAEDGLHVARVQPVGALVQLPPEEEQLDRLSDL